MQRVLIVDDMLFAREFMKQAIAKAFPEVEAREASSGTAAIELLRRERFDLVLCDWELPGAKGHEVLSALRASPTGRDTPFLMITASSEQEHVLKAKALGANEYLVKPVKLAALTEKVRELLFPQEQAR